MFEVAHQMALLPIVAMMLMGRGLPREYWLVALAFMVSWFGDSLAWALGGAWWGTYLWLPVQFWIVLMAFFKTPTNRVFSLGAVVILAASSWSVTGAGPDLLLTIAGSATVLVLMEGRLVPPLIAYFGLGTVAYLFMTSSTGDRFMVGWYLYQSCRLLAFILFTSTVIKIKSWPRHAALPY